MTNEVEVYFALKGDEFDPNEFSQLSGLTPTEIRRKGDPGTHIKYYKFSSWIISTGRISGDVLLVHELVDQLIERIEGSADLIAKAVLEFDLTAVLEVVLYIAMDDNLSTPALGFSPRAIAFLNRAKAEIDIDIYRNYD